MSNTITHFIWGYQQHFRVSAQGEARSLFQQFDGHFDPEVFIVGLLADKTHDKYHACVEPEDNHWTQSSDFDNTLQIAETIRPSYPESHLLHSHPLAQRHEDDRLFLRSLSDAVQRIISSHPARNNSLLYSASLPVLVNGYWVVVVLGLQQSVLSKYPALNSDSVPLHEYRNRYVSRSFLHSLRDQYLNACTVSLRQWTDQAAAVRLDRDSLARNAGKCFVEDVGYRTNQAIDVPLDSLFDIFTDLSSAPYEGRTAHGEILFAKGTNPQVRQSVIFQQPPSLRQIKSTRKLLEMASNASVLHTNGHRVLGLADRSSSSVDARTPEDIFSVRFLAHHHWQLWHEQKCLIDVKYGSPRPPELSHDSRVLASNIQRLLGTCTDLNTGHILRLIESLRSSQHGALLVITAAAKNEAQRFSSQASCIDPVLLTPELLQAFTSVDGAVLASPAGECHAFGVILDGTATDREDSSRGSRFNSAVRYVEALGKQAPVLAAVVSSDGGVTLLPRLRPMIQRKIIEHKLSEFASICQSPAIEVGKYNTLFGWLLDHRWYLLPEHCERINQLLEDATPKLHKQAEVEVFWLSPIEFHSHPHFNAKLHYAEEQPVAWSIMQEALESAKSPMP